MKHFSFTKIIFFSILLCTVLPGNEVEIKYRVLDNPLAIAFFSGFEPCGKKEQEDVYFDTAGLTNFLELRNIRLRNNSVFCVKQAAVDSFSREEYECKLPTSDESSKKLVEKALSLIGINTTFEVEITSDLIKSLLASYGFMEVARIRKTRIIYEVGRFIVAYDNVNGLGEFVESELKPEEPESKLLVLSDAQKAALRMEIESNFSPLFRPEATALKEEPRSYLNLTIEKTRRTK